MLYRRDTHVVELQMGPSQPRLEDACAPEHFDVARLPFVTLLGKHYESLFCCLTTTMTMVMISNNFVLDDDNDDDDELFIN